MADSRSHVSPVINVRGEKICLGPFVSELVPHMTRWLNDYDVMRTIAMDALPKTPQQVAQWVDQMTTSPTVVMYAVYDAQDMLPVGSVQLVRIDHRHQHCELAVGILEPGRRGNGLGTEAVRLMTDYAFQVLGMHNVHLWAYEFNHAGIRAYTRAGFKEYGRRRQAYFENGKWWDIIFMDVIAPEWVSPVMDRMMTPDERRD